MERVVHKASSHEEAGEWDVQQHLARLRELFEGPSVVSK